MNHDDEITCWGHADAEQEALLLALKQGDCAQLARTKGAFALILRERGRTTIFVSSSYLRPVYMCVRIGLTPIVGHALAEIAAASGTGWIWDFSAVADYLIIGHTLGSSSLHSQIQRVPIATLVRVDHKSGTCATDRLVTGSYVTASNEKAIEALVEAVTDCADLVSISGGLDSRLLLACMLARGRRPRLIVSGNPQCFDRQAADWISKEFGLPIQHVTIDTKILKATAQSSAIASNGMLPLTHWAGLAHLGFASSPSAVVGINGECVRDYYSVPRGAIGRGALTKAILNKQSIRLDDKESALFASDLEIAISGVPKRIDALLPDRQASTALRRFFSEQYALHKSGADAAAVAGAYGMELQTPFSEAKWQIAAEALANEWHTNDHFHVSAIRDLFPPLCSFPFRASHPGEEPYVDQSMFVDEGVLGLLVERREVLARLVTGDAIERIVETFVRDRLRPHLVFALLSLALFVESFE